MDINDSKAMGTMLGLDENWDYLMDGQKRTLLQMAIEELHQEYSKINDNKMDFNMKG